MFTLYELTSGEDTEGEGNAFPISVSSESCLILVSLILRLPIFLPLHPRLEKFLAHTEYSVYHPNLENSLVLFAGLYVQFPRGTAHMLPDLRGTGDPEVEVCCCGCQPRARCGR